MALTQLLCKELIHYGKENGKNVWRSVAKRLARINSSFFPPKLHVD